LRTIQEEVETLYKDGRPLHHLPSTSDPEFDPDGSSIFVVAYDQYLQMDTSTIQDIFEQRHILVHGVPQQERLQFDMEGLSRLGSLKHPRNVQGLSCPFTDPCRYSPNDKVGSFRTRKSHGKMLHVGTLQELYNASLLQGRRHIWNMLDFPMGHLTVHPPPMYRYDAKFSILSFHLTKMLSSSSLASHEQAMSETRGQPGYVPGKTFADELSWGTAALRGATSWPHADDDGFATVVRVMTGSKYWVVMRRNRDTPPWNSNGDMTTRNAFGKGWGPLSPSKGIWEKEGVLLTPNDVL
jgi:hypothetical protein